MRSSPARSRIRFATLIPSAFASRFSVAISEARNVISYRTGFMRIVYRIRLPPRKR